MTLADNLTIDFFVVNPREWPDAETLGISHFCGEKLPDFNTVLFDDYEVVKGCYFKDLQVYHAYKKPNEETSNAEKIHEMQMVRQ